MGVGLVRLAALLSFACNAATGTFECEQATECRTGASYGACELSGFCSHTDTACSSGWRYDEAAGDGLANSCVIPTAWGAPVIVPSPTVDGHPSLTDDMLELYFSRLSVMYKMTRPSLDDA